MNLRRSNDGDVIAPDSSSLNDSAQNYKSVSVIPPSPVSSCPGNILPGLWVIGPQCPWRFAPASAPGSQLGSASLRAEMLEPVGDLCLLEQWIFPQAASWSPAGLSSASLRGKYAFKALVGLKQNKFLMALLPFVPPESARPTPHEPVTLLSSHDSEP